MGSNKENIPCKSMAQKEDSFLSENNLREKLNISNNKDKMDVDGVKSFSNRRNEAFHAYPVVNAILRELDQKDKEAFGQVNQLCYDTSKSLIEKASKEKYLFELRNQIFSDNKVGKEIMNKLDIKDLKAFRQVCHLCKNQSKPVWLKEAWIHIKYDGEDTNQALQDLNSSLQEYLDSSGGKGLPVENFTVSLKNVYTCPPELETFIKICGPHIKSLEYSDDRFGSVEWTAKDEQLFRTVRKLMENAEKIHLKSRASSNLEKTILIGPSLPKLKQLQLTLSEPMQFDFLCKLPALKEIVLRGIYDGTCLMNFPNLFGKLWNMRSFMKNRNPEFLSLKKVDTIGVPKAIEDSLITANLPLEHLAMSLLSFVEEVNLANLLNHYSNTLKSVKLLKCNLRSCTPFSNVPLTQSFVNLRELELFGKMMTNLNILKNTPNLVKLKVDYGCFECPYFTGYVNNRRYDGPDVFKGDMVKHSLMLLESPKFRLEKLQEFVTDCKMCSESWYLLTKWMPNLRVLEAPIPSNTAMWDVCDNLDKLEKFRVRFGSDIDDGGIIGGLVVDLDDEMNSYRGITKLKNLRSFELEVECGQAKLMNVSAELGFLRMKHLGSLKLGFTGNWLTKGMERSLREKIGHVELYRSCSNTGKGEKIEKCCEWAKYKSIWRFV